MKWFSLAFIFISFSACSIFGKYKKDTFHYLDKGQPRSVSLIIPKGSYKTEIKTDSGSKGYYYHYLNGTILYFSWLADSSKQIRQIDYDQNIAKNLYHTIYFKGIDSAGTYWRETRFGHFKSGYSFVTKDNDGKFDSSINYFSLRAVAQ